MTIGLLGNESPKYMKKRKELTEAELALRDQRERVAALRRELPGDTEVEDYTLEAIDDGQTRRLRLSDLFEHPDRPLFLYQFMFGSAQQAPCPMCTMWTDGLNGIAHHVRESANFAVVAQAPIEDFEKWGSKRSWSNVRLLSSAPSPMKRDLGFENEEGEQMPGVSVFTRGREGLRHFYSVSAYLDDGEYRGIDLISPVWQVLDLLPEGRRDWMPSFDYERQG